MDNRYPPHIAAIESSPERVYVTHREPNLEAYLADAFTERGITYQTQEIVGPYRVYYDLSRLVTPQELGLGPGQAR